MIADFLCVGSKVLINYTLVPVMVGKFDVESPRASTSNTSSF
jgi:hypothetical protein